VNRPLPPPPQPASRTIPVKIAAQRTETDIMEGLMSVEFLNVIGCIYMSPHVGTG
jgi:hypothetical protein